MAPKARRSAPEPPRLLTPAEIDALRREMEEAGAWMRAELQRQALREGQGGDTTAAASTLPGSPAPSRPPAPAG